MPPEGPHHLHLDPLGGVAGDMLVAALWELAPAFRAQPSLAALGVPPSLEVTLEPGHDAGFAGSRLAIRGQAAPPPRGAEALLAFVAEAPLPDAVRSRVTDMLERLALAEARVHGLALAEVHFHELASWDTLIDLTLSAALLEGLRFVDDGIGGERVTPTGAAILAHLAPCPRLPGRPALVRSGSGFGTRRLPDRANQLRALLFEATGSTNDGDEIARIRFEIDDQSGEDLATGLDAVRATDGVVDVVAWPVFGKKGRIATAVQVLARPTALAGAIEACFAQTTTIGLRHDRVARAVLERRATEVEDVPVKEVRRPGGRATRKVEADAVAARAGDAAARAALRRRLERVEPS